MRVSAFTVLVVLVVLICGGACTARSREAADSRPAIAAGGGPAAGVPGPCAQPAVALAAGTSHTCALMADGAVRCWGANYDGQLGDGTTTFRSAPVRVVGIDGVVAIAAGDRHTCAFRKDGSVWCWGANDLGQVGKTNASVPFMRALAIEPEPSPSPRAVATPAGVTAIAAGATHSIALTSSGDVYFWGGLGSFLDAVEIRAPFKLSLSRVARIAAGGDLDCAFSRDRLLCWGPDLHWLGQETKNPFASVEIGGAGGLDPFAVGRGLACGVDRKRSVHCWGENESLGNGEKRSYSHPAGQNVIVAGLTDVVGLASRWQTCAVAADGRLACWGRPPFSGQEDKRERVLQRPAWMAAVADAVQVVVSESSSCVRTRSGRVSCWGDNGYGQLGDATTEVRNRPTEVRFCAETSEPIFPAPPDGVPLLAALQRGPCHGPCPIYSVRVHEDGTLIYRGQSNVRVRGGRKAQLSPADLKALRGAFQRADFLGLAYRCQFDHTDDSSARIFFTEAGKARLISHYHGCAGEPSALTTLEDEIDRIVETERWVGHVENGSADIRVKEGPLRVPGVKVEGE